jgi:Tol biopolymer transport system component
VTGDTLYHVCLMNPDGSGLAVLPDIPNGAHCTGVFARWSPDGKQIAYTNSSDVFVMNEQPGWHDRDHLAR